MLFEFAECIGEVDDDPTANPGSRVAVIAGEHLDLDRPILVGGKEYHNTKIVIEKENGKEVKQEEKKEVEEKQEEKKDIERDNTWLIIGVSALFLLFLFGLFIVGYLYFKIKKP